MTDDLSDALDTARTDYDRLRITARMLRAALERSRDVLLDEAFMNPDLERSELIELNDITGQGFVALTKAREMGI